MKKLLTLFIALWFSLAMQSPAWATWAHVQGKAVAGTATTSAAATFSSSVAVGNLVVVQISFYGPSASITSVVDNASTPNTYTLAKLVAGATADSATYYSVITTGGAFTVTVTCSAACYAPVAIDEYSFTPGTISVSSTSGASQGTTGTALAAGNVTFTAPRALITGMAGLGTNVTNSFTPSTGFTSRYEVQNAGGATVGLCTEDYLNATVSPQNPAMTLGTASVWSMAGVAFQSSGDFNTGITYTNGAALLMGR